MSRASVIAKLVAAGHEDLAEQLVESRFTPRGNTNPGSLVRDSSDGLKIAAEKMSQVSRSLADVRTAFTDGIDMVEWMDSRVLLGDEKALKTTLKLASAFDKHYKAINALAQLTYKAGEELTKAAQKS